jgi:hypothetical protein
MQFDYRQIYASILKDWMEVDPTVLQNDIFFGDFINGPIDGVPAENVYDLQLTRSVVTGNENFVEGRYLLDDAYPNPARGAVTIPFKINSTNTVQMHLHDSTGKLISKLFEKKYEPGSHRETISLAGLPRGMYVYRMSCGFYSASKKIMIQ